MIKCIVLLFVGCGYRENGRGVSSFSRAAIRLDHQKSAFALLVKRLPKKIPSTIFSQNSFEWTGIGKAATAKNHCVPSLRSDFVEYLRSEGTAPFIVGRILGGLKRARLDNLFIIKMGANRDQERHDSK